MHLFFFLFLAEPGLEFWSFDTSTELPFLPCSEFGRVRVGAHGQTSRYFIPLFQCFWKFSNILIKLLLNWSHASSLSSLD